MLLQPGAYLARVQTLDFPTDMVLQPVEVAQLHPSVVKLAGIQDAAELCLRLMAFNRSMDVVSPASDQLTAASWASSKLNLCCSHIHIVR